MSEEGESSAVPRPRRPNLSSPPAPPAEAPVPVEGRPEPDLPGARPRRATVPTLLDFFPAEDEKLTELHPFFDHLKAGRFTTTRCRKDGELLWPPRAVCPRCHRSELDWVDLPMRGRIYAHSAVLAGAPLGMEADVPFSVGLVDLEGAPLRLFGRIEGRPWKELAIGQLVRVEPYGLPDGRVFYRFRVEETLAPVGR